MAQEFKFKTDIVCKYCVARVKPFLDKLDGVASWSVNTQTPDKILTIESSGATIEQITEAVENVGFSLEKI